MIPTSVPDYEADNFPRHRVIKIGPPPSIADEDCGTVEALVGYTNQGGGAFDGAPEIRSYWKFTDEEIEVLKNGGLLEMTQFTPQMVVHSMRVSSNG